MEKRIEITMDRISDLLREWPEARADARVRVLVDLANEHEGYTKKLEWLSRDLVEEVTRNRERGLVSIHEGVLSTSLITDVRAHATKITALMRVLTSTCKAADDPKATALDELIRTLDPRG